MNFIPKKYQQTVINKIIKLDAVACFLDMGLGKSVATLTAIVDLIYTRFIISKVLIIAPLRVAQVTWQAEIDKWEHTRRLLIVSKILGDETTRILALTKKADIYIINRENVEWLVEYYKQKWPFDMVVIDESSSFKSSTSKRFKALKKVMPLVKKRVLLTGTPQPNSLMDLWSQIYLLDGGKRLGSTLSYYRNRYFIPGKSYRDIVYEWKPIPFARERIYKKLSDICIAMKTEDWLVLPKVIINNIEVQMTKEAQNTYNRLESDLIAQIGDKVIEASNKSILGNKLLQMANGAIYDDNKKVVAIHNEKIKVLEEIIENLNGQSVLIFYNYIHDLERIKKHLPNCQILKTEQQINDWNNKKIPILLAHPASAGHGLNLQAGGNTIIWFGLCWSLELYQQANKRLHRQGQSKPVIIHHILTKGTRELKVLAVLNKKDANQNDLFDALLC